MSNYSESKLESNKNTTWHKVLNLVENSTTVLDIGCSSGNFGAELIRRKNCQVDGIEIDPEDRKLAKTKLRKVYGFNIEDGLSENIQISSYDYVYYGDVIEHLVNPIKALENTKQLLKPDGRVLFSIPNMGHMLVRLAVLKGEFGYGETGLLDKTHLHFYDKKEVERVFNAAGYTINEFDFVLRDVPEEILSNYLAELGLRPGAKFFKMSKSIEAAGYQIIGQAQVAKAKPTALPDVYPPVNEMDQQLKRLHREHDEDIRRVRKHYERLLAECKEANNALEGSLSRKMTVRLKRKVESSLRRLRGYQESGKDRKDSK